MLFEGDPLEPDWVVEGGTKPASDASVVEGDSGTNWMQFNVWLTTTSALPVTVKFATASGTAGTVDWGVANVDFVSASGTLTIEIKSVNSRFLDLQFRINDDLRAVEPVLREAIMGRVTRGKLECRLSFGRKAAADKVQALNAGLLADLTRLQNEIRQHFGDAQPMSVNELLRWPGVIEEAELGQENLPAEVAATMASAMEAFVTSRAREGDALASMLIARIDAMDAIVQSEVTRLLNGYLDNPAVTENMSTYLTLPGLGARAGVLGAIALAQTA